ncbi:hypothetical protein LTR27_011523 [Elasticomyces elasticus]|nr:hypothetical protein LTR27_011523 [Elasticomyces elasticus]
MATQRDMAAPRQCTLLGLPPELRDQILDYALSSELGTKGVPLPEGAAVTKQAQCLAWTINFDRHCPLATYLSLMRCNGQLWREVTAYLLQDSTQTIPAKVTIHTGYPDMVAEWTCIPQPPALVQDLDISVKLRNLFDPALSTPHQHNVLLRPLYEIIRRYIMKGPHFAREPLLRTPLKLRTVRITMSSAIPLEDLIYVYGSPAVQIAVLCGHLKGLLARLARSGIMMGAVEALELGVEGEKMERFPVTMNIWDEQDYVFFNDAGFRWDQL